MELPPEKAIPAAKLTISRRSFVTGIATLAIAGSLTNSGCAKMNRLVGANSGSEKEQQTLAELIYREDRLTKWASSQAKSLAKNSSTATELAICNQLANIHQNHKDALVDHLTSPLEHREDQQIPASNQGITSQISDLETRNATEGLRLVQNCENPLIKIFGTSLSICSSIVAWAATNKLANVLTTLPSTAVSFNLTKLNLPSETESWQILLSQLYAYQYGLNVAAGQLAKKSALLAQVASRTTAVQSQISQTSETLYALNQTPQPALAGYQLANRMASDQEVRQALAKLQLGVLNSWALVCAASRNYAEQASANAVSTAKEITQLGHKLPIWPGLSYLA